MGRQDVPVGIDLGTTNSVVAAFIGGEVVVIPDADGNTLHPSVVAFKPTGERVAGAGARLRRIVDPTNTIFSVKRLVGLPFDSPEVKAALPALPYQVQAGGDGAAVVVTRAGAQSVVDLSSQVLLHLKQVAEAYLDADVTRCVITVPANFSDGQREATRRAGELAGLEVLRIINEPTAAAVAYALGRDLDQRIVVFDMGGGTFDVTLLAARTDFFEVIATGGDPFLGGDDMDRVIANRLLGQFLATHRIDLRNDPRALAIVQVAAEHVKTKLSTEPATTGTLKGVATGPGGVALSLDFELTRVQFEQLITPLVDRALAKCGEVLYAAGLTPADVDQVLLVGGATRIPLVRERVTRFFGHEPRNEIDPMVVVAQGAAVQAAALGVTVADDAPPIPMPILIDVTPHAIGLGTAGGYCEVLIEKNQPIPAERTQVFTTARDDQHEVVIRVCQGGSRQFTENSFLGEVRLEGLAAGTRGDVQLEVTFLVDGNGILQVAARDLQTGRATRATLRTVAGESR